MLVVLLSDCFFEGWSVGMNVWLMSRLECGRLIGWLVGFVICHLSLID